MVKKTNTTDTWNYYTHIWKTESAYLSWLRGQIRRIWNTCPQKIECLKKNLKRLPKYDGKGNPITYKNGKTKLYNAYQCELCDKICYQSDKVGNKSTYAVDHKDTNASLTKFEDVPTFVDALLRVKEKDLRILCYDCNMTTAYASKHNTTLEEAKAIKFAISLEKQMKDRQFFIDRKLTIPTSKEKRRQKIIELFLSENEKTISNNEKDLL